MVIYQSFLDCCVNVTKSLAVHSLKLQVNILTLCLKNKLLPLLLPHALFYVSDAQLSWTFGILHRLIPVLLLELLEKVCQIIHHIHHNIQLANSGKQCNIPVGTILKRGFTSWNLSLFHEDTYIDLWIKGSCYFWSKHLCQDKDGAPECDEFSEAMLNDPQLLGQ